MKRIYFYGRLTRLISILSLSLLIGLSVFGLIVEPYRILWTVLEILFLIAVLIYTARRLYTYRILIDPASDRICFILGTERFYRYERQLSRIERIEVVKEKGEFHFLVTHLSGLQEKLTYQCIGVYGIEWIQYRRLARAIQKRMAEQASAR